ncbi:MAG: ABC transporter permease subunit [Candidatus Eremiobacteraeota bacterium]|nr:ABC transporter permease subunit [Candidatus Eremiobacteraeota bacterium]
MSSAVVRAEWLKLKSYRPFWVVFTLYPVCLGGIVAMSLWGQAKMQEVAQNAGAGQAVDSNLPFAFPVVWQSNAYIASWLHFIPAILLILTVTNEFSFRTHRQNLLEGWSRNQFLTAKGMTALGLSLYCAAVTLVVTVIAGAVSKSVPTLEGAEYLLLFFLQSLVYNVFCLLLAFFIRRAALSLAAFLMYSVILENILAFLLNLKFAGVGHYLPLEAAGGLVPLPYLKEQAERVAPGLLSDPGLVVFSLVSVGYLCLFAGILWARFRREDL